MSTVGNPSLVGGLPPLPILPRPLASSYVPTRLLRHCQPHQLIVDQQISGCNASRSSSSTEVGGRRKAYVSAPLEARARVMCVSDDRLPMQARAKQGALTAIKRTAAAGWAE